jgi:hypothetical protein
MQSLKILSSKKSDKENIEEMDKTKKVDDKMKYLNPMTQLNRKIYMIQTHS